MTKRKAFTLVELLVVIGIISVLIAILLPALANARRAASKVACASQFRQHFTAFQLYAADFNDYLLPTVGVQTWSVGTQSWAGWTSTAYRGLHAQYMGLTPKTDNGVIDDQQTRPLLIFMCPQAMGDLNTSASTGGNPRLPWDSMLNTRIASPQSSVKPAETGEPTSNPPVFHARKLSQFRYSSQTMLEADTKQAGPIRQISTSSVYMAWRHPGGSTGTANVLMADGHVESMSVQEATASELATVKTYLYDRMQP